MKTLKTTIRQYMFFIASIIVVGVLIITFISDVLAEQNHEVKLSERMFYQIEHLLNDNEKDLKKIVQNYAEECLAKAELVTYMIENTIDFDYQIEEFREIADLVDVDEIHLFDENGAILGGTEENCHGLTFDSGEQINFFKPMLEDKTLRLCQPITPNTQKGERMQYSAVWSESGTFIVQIGMNPQTIQDATEKNDLTHIFSLLRVNVDASFYAIDVEKGTIVASTNAFDEGLLASKIGFSMETLKNKTGSFHAVVHGVPSYCVFTIIGDNYIGRVISNELLYGEIPMNLLKMFFRLCLIALILVAAVSDYMNRHVVKGIYDINDKLGLITQGNLEERTDVRSSVEFSELSDYINTMVKELSYLLRKIEGERDLDSLTGLYNRYGLDAQLSRLFLHPKDLGICAMIMIDSDGLKEINDKYGHEKGDIYLKETGKILKHIGIRKSIAARQGGDEFVLFLYEYETEEELLNVIKDLEYLQKNAFAKLDEDFTVEVGFSFGYQIEKNPEDYRLMLKLADEKMYENKRSRKGHT